MRIVDMMTTARAQGVDRLDAQWLIAHQLQRPRAWLLAHDDHLIEAATTAVLLAQLQRRAHGEPLAYVMGQTTFCGLALHLTPEVLVPRPETELLVEWAQQCLNLGPARSVIDLGTGSGAVALALARREPQAQLSASDASAAALAVAEANGARLGLRVEWMQGDWWAPLKGRRFGLAVSNPPYVAGNDPHLAALVHEPRAALTPEGDGLSALRRIVEGAPYHLLPGAWLLLEHGHDQGPAVQAMLRSAGFEQAQTRVDLAGLPRCTGAVCRSAQQFTA